MTTKMIGVKEFRQNMTKISNESLQKKQRLIILRKNEPIFELKPLSKEDASLEKLMADVNDSLSDLKKGDVYSHNEIKNLFGLV